MSARSVCHSGARDGSAIRSKTVSGDASTWIVVDRWLTVVPPNRCALRR